MFEKLKRMLSPSRDLNLPSSRTNLAQSVKTYPPYKAPHVGFGAQISELQAHENLSFFNSVRSQRLEHLSTFLREHIGIDIQPALSSPREHSLALTDSLNQWAGKEWHTIHDPSFSLIQRWVNSRREGEDIVLSLMMDLAILLGELVIRVNPDWSWGIDLDEGNLKDEMLSSRRIVLIADPVGEMPSPFVEDVEDVVVSRFRQLDRDNDRSLIMNPWRRLVDEGQKGAAMAFYRSNSGGR